MCVCGGLCNYMHLSNCTQERVNIPVCKSNLSKQDFKPYFVECKLVQFCWKTVWQYLQKLNTGLHLDPAILLPELRPAEMSPYIHLERYRKCSRQLSLSSRKTGNKIVHQQDGQRSAGGTFLGRGAPGQRERTRQSTHSSMRESRGGV